MAWYNQICMQLDEVWWYSHLGMEVASVSVALKIFI